MAGTQKANDMLQDMINELALRLPAILNTGMLFDTDGYPYCIFKQSASETAGQANWVIKVAAADWPLAKDVLGNAAFAYTPHRIQLYTEANSSSQYLSTVQLTAITGCVMSKGATVEWYEFPNADIPDNDFAEAVFQAKYDNLYSPLLASQ